MKKELEEVDFAYGPEEIGEFKDTCESHDGVYDVMGSPQKGKFTEYCEIQDNIIKISKELDSPVEVTIKGGEIGASLDRLEYIIDWDRTKTKGEITFQGAGGSIGIETKP